MKKKVIIVAAALILLLLVLAAFWVYDKYQWKKAKELYRTANYQELAKELKEKDMPNGEEELNIYARTMMTIGEYDKAYQAFTKLYQKNQSIDTKLLMGNVLMQKQDLNGAEIVYNEIIQQNPNVVQAALNLASIYRTQNQSQKANETLVAALKSNPNSAQIYEYLVTINTPASSSDYDVWVASLEKIDPNNPAIPKVEAVEDN